MTGSAVNKMRLHRITYYTDMLHSKKWLYFML